MEVKTRTPRATEYHSLNMLAIGQHPDRPKRRRRADLVAQATTMRAQRMTNIQIGRLLGITPKYVSELLHDPSGALGRARKTKRNCIDCGTAIRSDSPSRNPQLRCFQCSIAYRKATAKWTKQAIIEAIHRWNKQYGRPPVSADWNVAHR